MAIYSWWLINHSNYPVVLLSFREYCLSSDELQYLNYEKCAVIIDFDILRVARTSILKCVNLIGYDFCSFELIYSCKAHISLAYVGTSTLHCL